MIRNQVKPLSNVHYESSRGSSAQTEHEIRIWLTDAISNLNLLQQMLVSPYSLFPTPPPPRELCNILACIAARMVPWENPELNQSVQQ